ALYPRCSHPRCVGRLTLFTSRHFRLRVSFLLHCSSTSRLHSGTSQLHHSFSRLRLRSCPSSIRLTVSSSTAASTLYRRCHRLSSPLALRIAALQPLPLSPPRL